MQKKHVVWVYTTQDIAQTQENFARLNDPTTVTFNSSALVQEDLGINQ